MVAISGSLRRRSYNTALLRHATSVAPAGMRVTIAELADFPLYNQDTREEHGFPAAVAWVRRRLADADGLVIACPEYNHSITGVLKNAIDWLSIGADSPLTRIPAAILGVGGRLGTAKAQANLRVVLAHNDVQVLNRPEVLLANASSHFDDDLKLIDARSADLIKRLMYALAGQIRLSGARHRALLVGSDAAAHAGRVSEAGFTTVLVDAAGAAAIMEQGTFDLVVAPAQEAETELAAKRAGVAHVTSDAADLLAAIHEAISE